MIGIYKITPPSGRVYIGQSVDIKNELGFSNANICSCCKGNLKTSSGYIWKYKEN